MVWLHPRFAPAEVRTSASTMIKGAIYKVQLSLVWVLNEGTLKIAILRTLPFLMHMLKKRALLIKSALIYDPV